MTLSDIFIVAALFVVAVVLVVALGLAWISSWEEW